MEVLYPDVPLTLQISPSIAPDGAVFHECHLKYVKIYLHGSHRGSVPKKYNIGLQQYHLAYQIMWSDFSAILVHSDTDACVGYRMYAMEGTLCVSWKMKDSMKDRHYDSNDR